MNSTERWLVLLQLLVTVYMTGLIWFVQVVHYPLMARFDHQHNQLNQLDHQQRTTLVVIGPMLLSALLSVAFVVVRPDKLNWLTVVLNGLLTLIWAASTAFWQVPLHTQLAAGGFDPLVHQELVRSNWLRTTAWTLQLGVNVVMLDQLFRTGEIAG